MKLQQRSPETALSGEAAVGSCWAEEVPHVLSGECVSLEKRERVEVDERTVLVAERTAVFGGGGCSMFQNWGAVWL